MLSTRFGRFSSFFGLSLLSLAIGCGSDPAPAEEIPAPPADMAAVDMSLPYGSENVIQITSKVRSAEIKLFYRDEVKEKDGHYVAASAVLKGAMVTFKIRDQEICGRDVSEAGMTYNGATVPVAYGLELTVTDPSGTLYGQDLPTRVSARGAVDVKVNGVACEGGILFFPTSPKRPQPAYNLLLKENCFERCPQRL